MTGPEFYTLIKKYFFKFPPVHCVLIFSILTGSFPAFSQTSNWSAYLPAAFPTNVSGQIHGISRISQMKFHPTNSNKIYAVSARGGLFISTNAGTSWTVTPGTDKMVYSTFASVCVDFTNDQIIYLGAGDHNYYYSWGGATGVWKSSDGGQNFTQTSLNNKIIVEMIMDPQNHNIIVAATNGGLYKTINGGSTWTLKTSSREFDDLKQKTPVSRVLYAATRDSAFFRSTDFGDTWSQVTSGIVLPAGVSNGNGCRIAVTPADTNVVYFGMTANAGIIYKSVNGGTSFSGMKTTISPYLTYYENLSTSSGQGDYNFSIGVDRTNANILYLVAHNVWKSTDGGVNWTQLTNWWEKVHTDMHQIFTNPYNNTQLWNANDGGVWLSTDGGNNWTPKSDGIYGYEIYHGNCSPTRRDMISIGTQDNGELYSTTTGWFTNRGGDWGSQCAFDYRPNSSMVYYFSKNKRRLVTGGDQTFGLPANVTEYDDIAFHRSNINLAFLADSFIYRTTNLTSATPGWTSIYTLNKKVMAIHCSFADANRLYVITSDGMIYVSTNALSATPTFVSYSLPNTTNNSASITTIKNSPNTIYITCNTRVYRSVDNGATWTNITYNLPSVNHVRILADEYYSGNELVFIATSNAVYYKVAAAASWSAFNTNLPSRTTIEDMSVFNDSTGNSVLRVATYGRGIWESPISGVRSLGADLLADSTSICPGHTVHFTDISRGNVVSRNWSFPGGNPSASTAVNPSVVYNSPGVYNVTLTVADAASTSSITKTNYIRTTGENLPLAESFEGADDPPAGWVNIDNSTQNDKWMKTSAAGGFGTSPSSMMFDNYGWNVQGERDELQVRHLDFTGYSSVTLTFDVAYQVYSGYSDSLAVLISTDCGSTFSRVYIKGGATLSTSGSGTVNFVPTAAQWRTESVNLTSFAGQSNVILQFQNINGYGNKLYIDNVNISAVVLANAGADRSICSGSSVQIGMASTAGVNFSWSPATGLSSSTVSNPVASPTSTTAYILTATQPNSGISSKDTVTVTVTPSAALSVSISANPAGAICQGSNVTFTATAQNIGTGTYQWKKNGVNVGTNSSTYSGNAFVTGDVISCIVTNTASCITGSPATSNSVTMSVNPNVAASVSIASNPSTAYCAGTNVIFTATPVNGGIPGYNWKKNGTLMGITTQSFSINNLVSGDAVTCIMTSSLSCVFTNPVTSNVLTQTVNPLPSVSSFSPLSGQQGTSIIISGSGFINVTSVLLNNQFCIFNLNSPSQITATVPSGASTGNIRVITSCGSATSNGTFIVQPPTLTVNLHVLIEGFYRGNGAMTGVLSQSICDTVILELHQTVPPYSLASSSVSVIDTGGIGAFTFTGSYTGYDFYLVVKHRNALETWSALPVTISSNNLSYDFTTSQAQAHGNMLKDLNDGRYALYSGDINHDRIVNLNDLIDFESGFLSFAIGYYVTDLTGDNFTESADYSLLENNVILHPATSLP